MNKTSKKKLRGNSHEILFSSISTDGAKLKILGSVCLMVREKIDALTNRKNVQHIYVTEAQIQIQLKSVKRFLDFSVSSLIRSWLTQRRASSHQKLTPNTHG